MNTRSVLASLAGGVLLVAGSAASANAQQITLANSTQNVTFTGTGATNSLDLTLGSCVAGVCTLSGNAIGTDGEAGTYSLVTTTGADKPDFGPNNGKGVFPLSATDGTTTVFNFTDTTDGDSNLVGIPVTYLRVANGSSNPHLDFKTTLVIAQDDFIVSPVSCTGLPSGTACNIDTVALTAGATASAPISSGQIVTPEPASMLLLGSGLLALGAFIRRRGLAL